MLINVAAKVGQHCVASEDGEALNELIAVALSQGEGVELEFTGARIFSTPFFNALLGTLLQDFTPAELNERLRFVGLNADGDEILRRVVQNTREWFSSPEVREKLRELSGEISDEHRIR